MRAPNIQLTHDEKRRLAGLGVVLCYAHGSVVKGTAMRESDLDIAVLLERMPGPRDALRIASDITNILQHLAPKRELDVAILNEASPLFRHVVAVEGQLLSARSDEDRIQFEITAMHEYEASRRIHRIAFNMMMGRAATV